MFPDKWNGLSLCDLFSISYFFNALYNKSCYIILCHNTTLFVSLKKVYASFVLSIHSVDIAYLVFNHTIFKFHILYTCQHRQTYGCPPYIFFKSTYCCIRSLAISSIYISSDNERINLFLHIEGA